MNIKDIAKLAGVSVSTVSKVMNDYSGVSKKTKEKILAIINENNYIPNTFAKNLSNNKNKTIGIFIVDKGNLQLQDSFYFGKLVSLSIDYAQEKGYFSFVSIIKDEDMKKNIENFYKSKLISGSMVIGATINEDFIENLIKSSNNAILIDYKNSIPSKNIIYVNSNNYNGGQIATKYLIDSGCKNLLHVTGDSVKYSAQERLRGFEDCAKINKVKYNIFNGNFDGKVTEVKLKKYFSKLIKEENIPDGIFFANDAMALTFLEDFKSFIPQIKIVGFDNIILSSYVTPRLTSIDVDLEGMAIFGIDSLIKKLENLDEYSSFYYEATTQLVKRDT